MFGGNKTQSSTTPFGTAPVFGSTSTFGAQQTTQMFGAGSTGSTSTMFGSQQTATQQGSPAFGSGSQSQSSGSSMFGTSTQAPASTVFGQSTQSQSSTSPFGTAATFGTSAGSTTTTAANVGPSLFGASSQTSSGGSKSIFSAASKATPSKSTFGGARQTPTHPVFGGSSQSLQPTSSSTLFGAKSDQSSGSTFGGLGAGAPPPPPPYGGQSGTPIFGGQSETSSFGGQSRTSGFGAQSSSSGQPASVFGEKKSSTGERTVFQSMASTTVPTELFQSESSQKSQATAQSNEPAPLFGKPPKTEQSGSSGTTTFRSGAEVPQLFGKSAATSTSTQLFGRPPEEKTEQRPLFSKTTDTSGAVPKPLFGKPIGQTEEPKSLFGKPKDEERKPKPLFGKPTETGSETKTLFGKPTDTGSETKSLFGKQADPQGETSRSPPASRNLDTGEEERLPRRIRNWGGSRKTTSGKAAVGLFGKALTGVASAAEQDKDQEKAAEAEPKAEPRAREEKPTVRPLLQLPVAKPRRRASNEANDKLSIVAKNIPRMFNDKGMLKVHFIKFGKIARLYHNPEKNGAIITYEDPVSVFRICDEGSNEGKVIKRGVPPMALFWKKPATPAKNAGKEPEQQAEEHQEEEERRLPSFSADVNEELRSMSGTDDISSEEIHYLERLDPTAQLKSGRDKGQRRPRSSSPAPSRSDATRRLKNEAAQSSRSRSSESAGSSRRERSRSPSPKPKEPKTGGMYRHASLASLSGAVGHTAEERLDILENRDRIVRAALDNRDTNLRTAKVLKGTCPDMCPETERYKREARRLLHPYEMLPATGLSARELPKVDHTRAVKEYSRSSADQEMPLPHELRPSPVLNKTMIYLLNNIADLGDEGKWAEWYEFLWSRTRGIRKDVTQQQLCDLEAVECVEKCARFHIYCAERLCEEDAAVFDAKINSENLTKCLQTLREMYHDLEAKHKSYCPNEPEFRAYMVLMKLNEGDILRETQQLRDEIRQSPQVQFVLKVYSALNSNNYIKFFKLVRTGTFLSACLMHRYFNQVRMAALRTMSKCYVPSAQPVQYQLSELVRLLAFEDEGEAAKFCEHYGLYTEEGRVYLERNAFITPESSLAPCRAVVLVESKQGGSAGEVVNGGALPPNIVIKPISSFDDRGRFIPQDAAIPVTETSPEEPVQQTEDGLRRDVQVTVASVPSLIQDSSQNEAVKEIAKELFVEVIDEMATQLSTNFLDLIRMVTIEANEILHDVINDTTENLLREISTEVIKDVKRDQAEREAAELKEKLAVKERVAQDVCNDIVREEVDEAIKDVTRDQHRENQAELREESKHRVSEVIGNSLYEETLQEDIIKFALDFHQVEVEEKLDTLQGCEGLVKRLRISHWWKKWKDAHAGRTRLKRSMLTFPPAPSMKTPLEQLHEILPHSQGVRDDTVHLGNNAELTLEAPPAIRLGRTANYMNMAIYKHNQRVRRERAWRPLNVVGSISQEMLDRYANGKKSFSELHIFWKMVMSLPEGNEILSDWLKAKFKKGTVPNAHPGSKVSVLSLYSAAVENDRRATSLHLCISCCQGNLDEGDVWEIEQKCHFLGTSAILFVLDITGDARKDENWWLCEQLRLSRVMQAKPLHPAIPLVVLVHQSDEENPYTPAEIVENLSLDWCSRSGSVNQHKLIFISDDIEDPELTSQLSSCVEWLSLHSPKEPEIQSKDIVEYVEERLDALFTTPVYQNLALRRKCGLVDQAPEVLLDVYNVVIDHMVKQVTDSELKTISWPVPEFTAVYSDLPHADWNKDETLRQLEELLPHLLLPDPEPAESTGWDAAYAEVWQFVEMVAESGEGNKVELYSRIRWLLRKAQHDFEELSWFVEGTACSPTAFNLPWTEIIMACINYRMGGIKILIADSQEENGGITRVHYFAKKSRPFVYPNSWTQATKDSSHGAPKLETTIAIASQKRKLDSSMVSETSPKQARKDSTSPESTGLNRSEMESATTPCRLKLAKVDEIQIETDESAYNLSVSVANEKSENAKYEEYLQNLVTDGESDSFLWDIGAGYSSFTHNTPSGLNVLHQERTSFIEATQRRLSLGIKSNGSFEGDVHSRGDTLNETLEHLKDSLKSAKEADRLYEMKLQSLLIETP